MISNLIWKKEGVSAAGQYGDYVFYIDTSDGKLYKINARPDLEDTTPHTIDSDIVGTYEHETITSNASNAKLLNVANETTFLIRYSVPNQSDVIRIYVISGVTALTLIAEITASDNAVYEKKNCFYVQNTTEKKVTKYAYTGEKISEFLYVPMLGEYTSNSNFLGADDGGYMYICGAKRYNPIYHTKIISVKPDGEIYSCGYMNDQYLSARLTVAGNLLLYSNYCMAGLLNRKCRLDAIGMLKSPAESVPATYELYYQEGIMAIRHKDHPTRIPIIKYKIAEA